MTRVPLAVIQGGQNRCALAKRQPSDIPLAIMSAARLAQAQEGVLPTWPPEGYYSLEQASGCWPHKVKARTMRRYANEAEKGIRDRFAGHPVLREPGKRRDLAQIFVWLPPEYRPAELIPSDRETGWQPQYLPIDLHQMLDRTAGERIVFLAQAAIIEYHESGRKNWTGIAKKYGLAI